MSTTEMQIVYATQSAVVRWQGAEFVVTAGSHWRSDDPVVVGNPSLFSTDPTTGMMHSHPHIDAHLTVRAADVEQATAAPGERRQGRGRQ